MRLTVDPDKCTLCGACILTCPTDMVRDKGGWIKISRVMCIDCGHCVAVCPEGAVIVADEELRAQFDPVPDSISAPEDLLALLRRRRTVRGYKDEPAPQETLERLLDAARWAPSGANCQCAEYVVVTTPERRTALRERIMKHYRDYAASLADAKDAHPHVRAAVPALVKSVAAGRDRLFFEAPAIIVVHADEDAVLPEDACAFAACYIVLMAESLGLGTCFAGYASEALRALPEARAELGLPESHQVHHVIAVGRPAEAFRLVPPRRPAQVRWL